MPVVQVIPCGSDVVLVTAALCIEVIGRQRANSTVGSAEVLRVQSCTQNVHVGWIPKVGVN